MQIVKIKGAEIESVISINGLNETEVLSRYPGYEVNNFNFEQLINCYEVVNGTIQLKANWESLLPTEPTPPPPKISPIAYKMLWTIQERVGLKAMRNTDPVIDDLMQLVDDPRMTTVDLNLQSVQGAIQYCLGKLAEAGIIEQAQVQSRFAEILTGIPV